MQGLVVMELQYSTIELLSLSHWRSLGGLAVAKPRGEHHERSEFIGMYYYVLG